MHISPQCFMLSLQLPDLLHVYSCFEVCSVAQGYIYNPHAGQGIPIYSLIYILIWIQFLHLHECMNLMKY